jgi:NhaP-type Na+/H+ or K+/H+ antiporter
VDTLLQRTGNCTGDGISDEQRSIRVTECAVTAANELDIDINGKMPFTLIMIVAWGAMVRSVLKCYDISLPYTVVLMISGLIIGAFSKAYCEPLHEYTAIEKISSKVILFTFLPILIFESAFNIPVHKFYSSSHEGIVLIILLLAFL